MPPLQYISFVSPCFKLMNKVASDSQYNLPTLWYQTTPCGIIIYLVVLCATLRYLVVFSKTLKSQSGALHSYFYATLHDKKNLSFFMRCLASIYRTGKNLIRADCSVHDVSYPWNMEGGSLINAKCRLVLLQIPLKLHCAVSSNKYSGVGWRYSDIFIQARTPFLALKIWISIFIFFGWGGSEKWICLGYVDFVDIFFFWGGGGGVITKLD